VGNTVQVQVLSRAPLWKASEILVFPNKPLHSQAFSFGCRFRQLRSAPVSFRPFSGHQKAPQGTESPYQISDENNHGSTQLTNPMNAKQTVPLVTTLPGLVLQLFGGLRRAEAEELKWEDL
jgi:hypothetical protein